MKERALKEFPSFKMDKEAEDFVDNADLSEYDLSQFKTVKYEFTPKTKSISLRLPEQLVRAVKARAAKEGMPYSRYIRLVLEQALA